MEIAVVLTLSADGQMMVGEIDPSLINPEELQPVQTFEDAVGAAEILLLGEEAPPEVEENAFNQALNTPTKNPNIEEDV